MLILQFITGSKFKSHRTGEIYRRGDTSLCTDYKFSPLNRNPPPEMVLVSLWWGWDCVDCFIANLSGNCAHRKVGQMGNPWLFIWKEEGKLLLCGMQAHDQKVPIKVHKILQRGEGGH
jgi:hypothetical protein